MDTKSLIAETKSRFNHNAARVYLAEKFNAKLLVAEQGGLWKADLETLTALTSYKKSEMVLIDTFGNPVKVDREKLLKVLEKTYDTVMEEWHKEWQELETKR